MITDLQVTRGVYVCIVQRFHQSNRYRLGFNGTKLPIFPQSNPVSDVKLGWLHVTHWFHIIGFVVVQLKG